MTDPIPAATVILFRDRPGAAPELLMVERARSLAFAGGMMVFPGGRVDPGDIGLAATPGDDGAARVAAIRETVEEVGLPLGLVPTPDPHRLATIRAALHRGDSFADALSAAGCALDLGVLQPFARWCPKHLHSRIFDTRFFLARAPETGDATVDATENVRLTWITAADALAEADAGRSAIIFPTRRNLERLARFASFDEAVADALAHPQPVISPTIEARDGCDYLCIPEGIGYPVTAEPVDTALRG